MFRRRTPASANAHLAVAQEQLRQWPHLTQQQRDRHSSVAARLLSKRWEPANGFRLDDAMKATVAADAALLHAGHDETPFVNVTAIVVHPTTMVLRGPRPGPVPGTVTDAPLPVLGHTSARGPVFIAWDVVEREQRTPVRSSNVILHEFAHKDDALNGTMDGTPRLADADQLRRWIDVCTAELSALRRGAGSGVLRPYAATNPSEFFAVATEAFFEQPHALHAVHPDLYRVLAGYYRQDTAAREPLTGES